MKYPRISARRAAIADEVDRIHEARLRDLMAALAVLRPDDSEEKLAASVRALFPAMFKTAALHGYFIAILAARLDFGIAKPGEIDAAEFASAERETYDEALAYWRKKFKLTDDQVARVESSVAEFIKRSTLKVADLVGEVIDTIVESFAEAFTLGLDAAQFARRIGDVLEGFTRARAEALFRTTMTESYGEKRRELIDRNLKFVPFTQFIGLTDDRQTLSICKPMSGYIAASDDPIWRIWQPPNHYQCRSDLSPIGYLEAIRMGIAKRNPDGTIVLTKGKRPFGPPPRWAINEQGKRVRVEPASGFGG